MELHALTSALLTQTDLRAQVEASARPAPGGRRRRGLVERLFLAIFNRP
ncbi:MAG: hypothetical protein ACR2J4_05760 [Deinococcus sp.]